MTDVAIIGSGPSGLTAAKAMVEHGLEPVVFESADSIGGMWSGPGRGAWSSVARTNLSYYSCAFSDLCWTEATDTFPLRKDVIRYLHRYATDFGLFDRIAFGRRVRSITAQGKRRWRIDYSAEGEQRSAEFHDVIVASGIFSRPSLPSFPGLGDYAGAVVHSEQCDSPERIESLFSGKRVLVVGAAFSGTEIAAVLTGCARSVTVTFRNPMWFVPRWVPAVPGGRRYPLDLVVYSRRADNPVLRSPRSFFRMVAGDPGEVSPELAFDPDCEEPLTSVITDDFLGLVGQGKVAVKRSRALRFDRSGVVFADDSRLEVDAVVMCTGYTTSLPLFEPRLLETIGYDPAEQFMPTLLHRHMFHPDLPGLAFVGHYRGPYFPVMELQARWIARIWAAELSPPSRDEMLAGIEDERRLRAQRPRPQFPHSDFVGLADGLAREVGVYPALDESDPLRLYIARGPVVPAHYRLVGPQADRQLAEEAIRRTPSPLID